MKYTADTLKHSSNAINLTYNEGYTCNIYVLTWNIYVHLD